MTLPISVGKMHHTNQLEKIRKKGESCESDGERENNNIEFADLRDL